MRVRRLAKNHFIASVRHADGETYQYVYFSTARCRRDAEDDARTSVEHSGGTLVGLTPIVEDGRGAQLRRLLVVAGLIVAVGGTTIAAAMIIVLTLKGAL